MQKINVSAISYSNSITFLYGLLHSEISNEINLSIDIPAVCADKLIMKSADIGLIPIVETLKLDSFEIISDLCIGADDYVQTVALFSTIKIEKIKKIYLDYQSRTSIVLIKILARYHWKQAIEWIPMTPDFDIQQLDNESGAVIIGDRTFYIESKYKYDLAHEWKQFTGLPFVFAAWVSNREIDADFKIRFNNALTYGIEHIDEAVVFYKKDTLTNVDIATYLRKNINYLLDTDKRKAMDLFLQYAKEI